MFGSDERRTVDVAHGEMAEKQLDILIQRRSRKGEVDPDERCDSCGRPLWCVLKVVYEDTEDNDAA